MTPQQAKELSLIKWEWILEHPEYDVMYLICPFNKEEGPKYYLNHMPQDLQVQIKHLAAECGLCEYFINTLEQNCADCILIPNCTNTNGYFKKFQCARTIKTRKKYAQLIVDTIKAWEV